MALWGVANREIGVPGDDHGANREIGVPRWVLLQGQSSGGVAARAAFTGLLWM